MKHVVGVSDMKVTNRPEDEIVTHSLGSCIGVSIYDPVARVGGLLHFQLPTSKDSPEKAAGNPFMYADTGIPAFFKAAYSLGGEKGRMKVKIAGGASVADKNDFFQIGNRNYVMVKKLFWKNGVLIDSEDIGGNSWRTMRLEMASGNVWIKNGKGEYPL